MAGIEPLMSIDELKMDRLQREGRAEPFLVRYHNGLDALIIYMIESENSPVVFYLDENLGVLLDPKTKEIVGLQIEGFQKSFLPRHTTVRTPWQRHHKRPEDKAVAKEAVKAAKVCWIKRK